MDRDQKQPSAPVRSAAVNVGVASPKSGGRALGRGLDALLPSMPAQASTPPPGDLIHKVPVARIDPNPYQTRRVFEENRLRELADSIKMHGVMQPVVLRRAGERFLLIAGERRWRATTLAGLPTIPAIVRDVPESSVLELTLIENIQREDLNPIEIAEAFARLSTDSHLTHEQIAARTGKDRASITNYLRLLKLPSEVRERIATGELTMGHAKALLSLPTEAAQKALASRIIVQGLSVREAEALTKASSGTPRKAGRGEVRESHQDPNIQAAVTEMERALGARVRLVGNNTHGKLVIEYFTAEDLDRVYSRIIGR